MIRDETPLVLFVGFFIGFIVFIAMTLVSNGLTQNENDLLRFCMTHSIPMEQCKIPEKGE